MLNSNLIGLSGKLNSGKDTVGQLIMMHVALNECPSLKKSKNNIQELLSNWEDESWMFRDCSEYQIKKFAYKLKQIISILTGIPILDLEKAEVKNSKVGEEWAYLLWFNGKKFLRVNPNKWNDFEPHRLKNYTFREMLQYLGTELFREQLHEDVWVNAMFSDFKSNDSLNNKWIITDVRFPNEAEAIRKRNGLLIRVENPNYVPTPNEHSSETSLDDYENFSATIVNNKDDGLEKLSNVVFELLKSENII